MSKDMGAKLRSLKLKAMAVRLPKGEIFMLKRLCSLTAVTIIMVLLGAMVGYAEGSVQTSSYGGVTVSALKDAATGTITLTGTNETGKTLKILVQKTNIVGKWYDVRGTGEFSESIQLIDGAGTYEVYVMINNGGDVYIYGPGLSINYAGQGGSSTSPAKTEEIDSSKTADNNITELAKQLVEGKKTSREKIEAIDSWIAKSITYDNDKYANIVKMDFTDQYGADVALTTKKGVCYDYSKLFTELCKAAGIQARMAKGYSVNILGYHAWNEVYDSDTNEWIIIDSTLDSIKYHKTGDLVVKVRAESEYYTTEVEL